MKISVIIPAYNRVSTLARAIDSVLAQSYSADEIIVVDDGSTDATSEVAKMYDEVNLLRQKKMGVSAACNNGVMMATNEWIAFLDPDDTWHPQKLQEQVAYHRKNKACKASYTDEMWIRDDKEIAIPEMFEKPRKATFENCLIGCDIAPSSVVMQKKLFDRLGGFDESMEACEDYDLWLRILQEDEIALIDRKLVNRHIGSDDELTAGDSCRVKALEKHLESRYDAPVRRELIGTYRLLAEEAKKDDKEDEYALYMARIEQLEAGV